MSQISLRASEKRQAQLTRLGQFLGQELTSLISLPKPAVN